MELNLNATPAKTVYGEYFRWLANSVGLNDHNGRSYWQLAKALDNIIFYSSVKNDNNRIGDAVSMRNRWVNDYTASEKIVDSMKQAIDDVAISALIARSATVLEVLVAFSIRIEEDIMLDDTKGDRTRKWFWIMIGNLGLGVCADDNPLVLDPYYISSRVGRMLDRSYSANGDGGLWPVKFAKADQRKVEIWYQFSAWLNENTNLIGDEESE